MYEYCTCFYENEMSIHVRFNYFELFFLENLVIRKFCIRKIFVLTNIKNDMRVFLKILIENIIFSHKHKNKSLIN